MKIIVGLGNPGDKYQNTRHNAGFMVLDELALRFGGTFSVENKFRAAILKSTLGSEQVLLVKPLTFMNLSGEALALIMNYYKINAGEILIVFDDIALDLGTLRFRSNGSDGGHNGIKSVIKNLGGSKDFSRLKVGIGPQPPMWPSEKYVLGEFTSQEKELLTEVVQAAANAVECWVKDGIQSAQCKFNGTINL